MNELKTVEVQLKRGRAKDAEVLGVGIAPKFDSIEAASNVVSPTVQALLLNSLNSGLDAWCRNRWRGELERKEALTSFGNEEAIEKALQAIADGSNITQTTKLRAAVAKLFAPSMPESLSLEAQKAILGYVRLPSTAVTGNPKAIKWLVASFGAWLGNDEWAAHLEGEELLDVATQILAELEVASETEVDFTFD